MRWTRTMEASGLTVTVSNQELRAQVDAGAVGFTYVTSIAMVNMTSATASVEVPEILGGAGAMTFFALTRDLQNYYWFKIGNGTTMMQVRELGVDREDIAISYDAPGQRYLRFGHNAVTNMMEFFTSSTGGDGTWAMRHAITLRVPIDALAFELGVGAESAALTNTRQARFDNFEYCRP